jgi:hypothetical protein
MTTIYFSHEDENEDGITDRVRVYSNNFHDPLFGDYRGVALAEIHYCPGNRESVERAEEVAMYIVDAEVAKGAEFDPQRGNKFQSYFKTWTPDEILARVG